MGRFSSKPDGGSFEDLAAPTKDVSKMTSEKPGTNGYLRIFSYGCRTDYVLEAIAITAAIASGVALPMVNLVIGNLFNILSDANTADRMPDNFMQEVSKNSLYFIYIAIVRLVCAYVYSSLFTYVGINLTRNIRHDYLRAALSQEVGHFDRATGSISMQAISNGKLIQTGISEKLGQIFQALATFIAAFAVAFSSQWKLTLILIYTIPVLVLIVSAALSMDSKVDAKILKLQAQAGAFVESVLVDIRTVHAYSLGSSIVDKYSGYLHDIRALGNKKSLPYAMMFSGQNFVLFATMGLAFWQGIAMIDRGEVNGIGTIFVVLFSIIMAAATIQTVGPTMLAISRAATAATELFSLIDRESEINPLDGRGDYPDANHTSGIIDLENVAFSYPTRPDIPILQDFSLHIPAGKVTAIVGASGSGKSTIVGLLERWYNPTSGSIKLDGKPISEISLKWLRTNIRLVQQEPVLFNRTVFENIAAGLIGTEWELSSQNEKLHRVQAAAKLAFADEFIRSLPAGYDTRVGEKGGLLSGGQKQRLAIARSIISEPRILLLDEATSALDPQSEDIVQKALSSVSQDRTVITIAHKLKTIQAADNIVVMKQGRIVEQGCHDDLVALGGVYSKMAMAQDLSTGPQLENNKVDEKQSASTSSDSVVLEPSRSVKFVEKGWSQKLSDLKDREDYALAPHTGVLKLIFRLISATLEIKPWYIATVMTCAAAAVASPGQALLLGNVVDVFGSDNMKERGNFISLMFFVMSLGLLAVYGGMGWSTNIIAQTFSQAIRKEMLTAMLRQDLQFFDRPENTVGSLTTRIETDAQSIFELMGFNIALLLISILTATAGSIMAITVAWKLGLVGVFAGLPPMILAGYIRIRIEKKMDVDLDKLFSESASIASETIAAIRTVCSLSLEEDVLRRYTEKLDLAKSEAKKPVFTMMIVFAFSQSVEFLVLALGFWWGSKLVSNGEITVYQFIVSFMGVYFSGQSSAEMFSYSSSFTKATSAANYFFWLQDLTPSIRETPENKEIVPRNDCKTIDLQHVHFAYPLAPSNHVLKGISLKIDPGQFVAFVGASGCGKSTMISLLERFYDPTTGSIIIDGDINLTDLNPHRYRNLVSVVQQEPRLFPVSIRENIAMGLGRSQDIANTTIDSAIEEACRAANVWDFISSLPEGLDTLCGTGGSSLLSGGQRQRIAVARALVRDPKIILLDEATSALDTESERAVQEALMDAAAEGGRITVAVAHRLSTIREADRIFVFFRGRVVEAGTHSELVAQGGMYKLMCEAQSLDTAV